MLKTAAKGNNNFMSWLWSYITWPYTQTVAYIYQIYQKKDAKHKKDDDHDLSSLISVDSSSFLSDVFRKTHNQHRA